MFSVHARFAGLWTTFHRVQFAHRAHIPTPGKQARAGVDLPLLLNILCKWRNARTLCRVSLECVVCTAYSLLHVTLCAVVSTPRHSASTLVTYVQAPLHQSYKGGCTANEYHIICQSIVWYLYLILSILYPHAWVGGYAYSYAA